MNKGVTDMTKYTKRQYLADIAANEAAVAEVANELSSYADRAEAGKPITEALSQAWNAAHDREWDLEQERAAVERKWSMRHWTAADHALAELVALNID